jgi:hypothetical protein
VRRICERIREAETKETLMTEPMGLRERVQQAIEAPVGRAESLLDDVQDADVETKLSILINGWCRGVSAVLEELAIAIDDLSQPASPALPAAPAPVTAPDAREQRSPQSAERPRKHSVSGDVDEEGLIAEARRSSEETAEIRKEGEQVRRSLEQ